MLLLVSLVLTAAAAADGSRRRVVAGALQVTIAEPSEEIVGLAACSADCVAGAAQSPPIVENLLAPPLPLPFNGSTLPVIVDLETPSVVHHSIPCGVQCLEYSALGLRLSYKLVLTNGTAFSALVQEVEVLATDDQQPRSLALMLAVAARQDPSSGTATRGSNPTPRFSVSPTHTDSRIFTGASLSAGAIGQFLMSESSTTACPECAGIAVEQLALPMVTLTQAYNRRRLSLIADPYFSTAFVPIASSSNSSGFFFRWVFNTARTIVSNATANNVTTARGERPFRRRFGAVLHEGSSWEDDISRFYDVALPQIPAAPAWTKQISLSSFDFLTNNGSTWAQDVEWYSSKLSREDRNRLVFAQQGWYDVIGDYSYDYASDSFESTWIFSPNSPRFNASAGKWDCSTCHSCCNGPGGTPEIWPLPWSVAQVRASYKLAQDAGIRTIHYFGDGLAICKTSKRYTAGGVATLDNMGGYLVSGTSDCVCPEGSGGHNCNTILNPLDPAVRDWFLQYMRALLRTFGDVIDGFVWCERPRPAAAAATTAAVAAAACCLLLAACCCCCDRSGLIVIPRQCVFCRDETFYINTGHNKEAGGYAAQAFLTLVEELTALVHEHNSSMVFLASDIPLSFGNAPAYSMVSDGNFADFETYPVEWPTYQVHFTSLH